MKSTKKTLPYCHLFAGCICRLTHRCGDYFWMSMKALEALIEDRSCGRNIAIQRRTAARDAVTTPLPQIMHPALKTLLEKMGIDRFYSHQAAAWDVVVTGKNCVITSGVASGKSLCYYAPMLHTLQDAPSQRALLLFPTKALTQDQHKSLLTMLAHPSYHGQKASAGIYDGDTPAEMRRRMRTNTRFIFTNPDMLHLGILPHHTNWKDFFTNLRYVVIDEVHVYRGVFGSHVTNVLRRLKRLCRFYGSKPQFILTSATLDDVDNFAETMLEEPVTVILNNGAPRGEHHLVLYNPPIVNKDLGIRRSALHEAVRVACLLHDAGIQTLVFAPSRRMVELMVTYIQSSVEDPESVHSYRSGYLPKTRREIEYKLKTGALRTVVATNALELGIDVGGIDAVVMCGYPGSIASFRQQSGRAGRSQQPSLTVMVASANLLDQYIITHPEFLLHTAPEQALINPDNPFILLHHMKCALFEKPFITHESFGGVTPQVVDEYIDILRKHDLVYTSQDRHFWKDSTYPAQDVSLRTSGIGDYLLRVAGTTIGLVDEASAFWMTHPQAIYLHQGESYLVQKLDMEQHEVELIPQKTDYYTQALSNTQFELIKLHTTQDGQKYTQELGQIKVSSQVTGFKKIKWHTNEILGYGIVELPQTDLITVGTWFTINSAVVDTLDASGKWNSKSNNYGSGWKTITEKIKERDKHTCQHCGLHENLSKTPLHVHHKIPFKQFTDPHRANHPENLVTLCPTCHRAAEQQYRVQSSLAGLAYLLRNMAPFHLMCDRTDVRVQSEQNLTLAQGRPGIVMYDAFPGGIGLSEKLFTLLPHMLQEAQDIVLHCNCQDGCPACVGPVAEQGSGSRLYVIALLKELLSC